VNEKVARTAHQLTANSGTEGDGTGVGVISVSGLENVRVGRIEKVFVRVARHEPGHRPEQKYDKMSEHFFEHFLKV
jgi:hypothetical protein